jgi:hypothetical protein
LMLSAIEKLGSSRWNVLEKMNMFLPKYSRYGNSGLAIMLANSTDLPLPDGAVMIQRNTGSGRFG